MQTALTHRTLTDQTFKNPRCVQSQHQRSPLPRRVTPSLKHQTQNIWKIAKQNEPKPSKLPNTAIWSCASEEGRKVRGTGKNHPRQDLTNTAMQYLSGSCGDWKLFGAGEGQYATKVLGQQQDSDPLWTGAVAVRDVSERMRVQIKQ